MRRKALLTLFLGLIWIGLAAAGPASAISELFDPETMILPEDVAPGTIATAKSVFHGTEIVDFEVEIISVITKTNLGGDLILCKVISGPVVDRNAGILRGMSGSPVYVDGKMLGAMSSTYAFAKEAVGMITPLVDMLDTFTGEGGATAGTETVEGLLDEPILLANRLVNRIVVTRDRPESIADVPDGTAVFVPVEAPVFMSGLSTSAQAGLSRIFAANNLVPLQGPGAGDPSQVVDLQPGSAMSITLMAGDFSASVGGTVTWRDGDRILGFGHPFMSAGTMDMPLAGAYVHDIVPSLEIGSKIMSPLASVGAILYDNNWAVGGTIGQESPIIPFDIEVVNETNGRVGKYHVDVVRDPMFTSVMLTTAAASALEAITYGMARTTVNVSTEVESDRGTLSRENTYYSPRGGAMIALSDLSEAVMVLTRSIFDEAEVTSGRIVCHVKHERGDALIESVELEDYVVRPGQTLRVGVVLRVGAGERVKRVIELAVPEDTPTGPLQLAVCSGGMLPMVEGGMNILWPEPRDLDGLMDLYRVIPPNHQIIATLASASESMVTAGTEMPDLPSLIAAVIGTAGTTDLGAGQGHLRASLGTDWAVEGAIMHPIIVVRPEDEGTDVGQGSRTPVSIGIAGPSGDLVPAAYGLGGPCGEYISIDPQMRELLAAIDPYDLLGADRSHRSIFHGLSDVSRPRFSAPERHPVQDGPVVVVGEEELDESGGDDAAADETLADTPEDAEAEGDAPSEPEATEEKGPEEDLDDLSPTAVRAPQTWTQGTRDDFLAGEPDGVSVNELGTLTLTAPLSTVQADFDDLYLWDCALAPDGSVYLGTGRDGGIFRVDAEGAMTRFFTTDDLMVFSLEVAADGTLYAGTGPKGLIYRIAPDGQGEVLCETGENYVWDLVFDADGVLHAGTGSRGRILAIRDGQPEIVYDSTEAHINVLCLGTEGQLLAGTGETGTIVEISAGTARTLCESPNGPIHCLAPGAEGDIYFGSATMDSASIHRLTAEGDLRTLHETDDGALFAMASDGEGRAFAGTGAFARLFLADSEDHVALIGEAEESESQFMALSYNSASKLLYACAANPPRLYRADLSNGNEGAFTSAVFDAEAPVQWTGLEWLGDIPESCATAVQIRTGNAAAPDATWSGWSRRYAEQGRAGLSVPDGRYLQYRVTLTTEDGAVTPTLDAVRVYYLARNGRPTLTLDDELAAAVSGDVELAWTAEDPNEDTLSYALYASADASETWEEVETDLEEMKTTWDTTDQDDGLYALKLVASDAKQNPTDALEGDLVFGPTLVDNTEPKVSLYSKSIEITGVDSIHVTSSGADEGSGVKSAQYRIDDGDWKAVPALDGLFDSDYERFEFDVADLPGGEITVEIVVFDEAGNKASGKEKVTLEGSGEEPAEEPAEEAPAEEGAATTTEPTEATSEPAEELTAEEVIERMAAAYEGISDFKVAIVMSMKPPPGLDLGGTPADVEMEMTLYYKRPNQVAVEMLGQAVPVPESEKDSMWTPESVLDGGDTAKLVGKTTKAGVTTYEIDVVPDNSETVKKQTLYVESEHWTVTKALSVMKIPSGGTAEAWSTMTYQDVDGFFVPTLAEHELPKAMFGPTAKGNGKAVMKFKNWRINKGVPASVFKG